MRFPGRHSLGIFAVTVACMLREVPAAAFSSDFSGGTAGWTLFGAWQAPDVQRLSKAKAKPDNQVTEP